MLNEYLPEARLTACWKLPSGSGILRYCLSPRRRPMPAGPIRGHRPSAALNVSVRPATQVRM